MVVPFAVREEIENGGSVESSWRSDARSSRWRAWGLFKLPLAYRDQMKCSECLSRPLTGFVLCPFESSIILQEKPKCSQMRSGQSRRRDSQLTLSTDLADKLNTF